MVYLFYTTYISVDVAHHKIFCAKVGNVCINVAVQLISGVRCLYFSLDHNLLSICLSYDKYKCILNYKRNPPVFNLSKVCY